VKPCEAEALIAPAIPAATATWADIGAGEGIFTRALVRLLGPESRIYALDRDAAALNELERWASKEAAKVTTVQADFTRDFDLPGMERGELDGILLANALHFVRDPAPVLRRLAAWLRPGGRVVFVEYDRRGPNPWVPHPIPAERLGGIADSAGLANTVVMARQPSRFGGELYVAVAQWPMQQAGR
jgi:SAM-dependent methyltransferase